MEMDIQVLTLYCQTKILNAKTRIYLSTLYIGKSEHELVNIATDWKYMRTLSIARSLLYAQRCRTMRLSSSMS